MHRIEGISIRPAYKSNPLRQETKRSIVCPNGSDECADGTTCCKLHSAVGSGFGCCPVLNAVCCSDGIHCCPSGYVCDLARGQCTK